jgi:glycosyltransferase involved in cell wall biosynthesis
MDNAARLTIGIDGRFLQDKFHGIGRYTYGLLTGLGSIEGDHRVIVFWDPALPNSRFPLHRVARPGKLEFHRISVPLYGFQELWAWPLQLHRTPVDVFHSPYFWSPVLLPCPLVITVHDMIFDRYPQYIPGARYLLPYRMMSRLAFRMASRIITVSEATARDIVQFAGTRKDKIVTVLSGVDKGFHSIATNDECCRVRSKYALPASYVLVVGARRPHKNIARLVAAFSRIRGEVSQSLVLVGSIDERFVDGAANGIAMLKGEGRVLEIAHVDEQDLPTIYSMADLFVQPSIIEGFGLPVLEAMTCGCPVACSNTSSLPEVAGDAAILFDPRSDVAIAETMRKVLTSSDLRQSLSRRGLQQADRFTWEAAATTTLDVYRSAAAGA